MKLLLTVCLTCTLLYTAESLRCHVCDNEQCTNTTSVECPATSIVCKTVTSVTNTIAKLTVNKNCSSLVSCFTPLQLETEWSVNRGFKKEAHNQLCCVTDNCNFQTLAIPNPSENGKQCPSCASSADSLAGTCNATLSCAGVENSCFNGTTTSNSKEVLELGCVSRNLCTLQVAHEALFGSNAMIVCGAPWSVRISAVLLTLALTAHKVLV
ncbi:phospholipase A2 inhibitor and Ly6/PLAUR domain-containing protein-like [Morone saxatilis]|uniref:phospholipase A2 inhibitor and Ly6/PLAUR domain-containing protein-like n=1 Tax=Morone saxatilis TaxID=34816 RepID=UPI0015E2072C|nr:phospholipase A2 inhibitor and Ly6/PLAUR domain-containing protein-like [Morone saxatilis]